MAELTPRSLDWIAVAPVSITGSASTDASPQAVFDILADHERWPEWFPNVKRVEVTGSAAGVGARRRVTVPGMTVDEEFIVWDPAERWTFTGLTAKPRFTRSLVEDCRIVTRGGRADISYTMYLEPGPVTKPLLRLVRKHLQRSLQTAMENLAVRAASPS